MMDQVYKPQNLNYSFHSFHTIIYQNFRNQIYGGEGDLLTFEPYDAGEFHIALPWQKSVSYSPENIALPLKGIKCWKYYVKFINGRLRLKCDGTRAETRFCLLARRTSPFKSAGVSVQSTTGNRGVRISGSNAGYTKFQGSVKGTGYPLHSSVSPSLPLLCVTVCHHVSTGL
jgi:hypothetical protein